MASVLYFVSDLHFGGDGDLRHCDFTEEFIAFLRGLRGKGEDAELIIAGDTFGFWELTTVTGTAKLDKIIADHQAIFDELRSTGETVAITLMVGNHDYDLACDPGFAPKLAAYNIRLDTAISLSRPVAGPHGMDRARPAGRRLQRLARLRQSLCAADGLFHHRDGGRGGEPAVDASAAATGSRTSARSPPSRSRTGSSPTTSTAR